MYDLLYIAGTIAFFALMIAYVAGCTSLGADTESAPEDVA
jgi:hypothetical protein